MFLQGSKGDLNWLNNDEKNPSHAAPWNVLIEPQLLHFARVFSSNHTLKTKYVSKDDFIGYSAASDKSLYVQQCSSFYISGFQTDRNLKNVMYHNGRIWIEVFRPLFDDLSCNDDFWGLETRTDFTSNCLGFVNRWSSRATFWVSTLGPDQLCNKHARISTNFSDCKLWVAFNDFNW